jgi:hypothetical protein
LLLLLLLLLLLSVCLFWSSKFDSETFLSCLDKGEGHSLVCEILRPLV